MLTDTEIRKKGKRVLIDSLGDVDAEKFIRLILKEPFDYTKWQELLWVKESIEQLSEKAMVYRSKNRQQGT